MKWLDLGLPLAMWLVLAVAAAAVCVPLWWSAARRLLPLRRAWPATWNGLDVLAILLLCQLVPTSLYLVLVWLGVFQTINTAAGDPLPPGEMLWAQVIALPVQVLLIVSALWLTRGAPPSRVGLTCVRWAPNVVAGFLVWVVVTPLLSCLYFLLLCVFEEPQHPFLRLDVGANWLLLLVGVSVAAPVAEELVFRGVLLPWSLKEPFERQQLIGVAAVLIAFANGYRMGAPFNPAPGTFAFLMLPGFVLLPYLLLPRRPGPDAEQVAGELWWQRLVEPARRPEARPIVAVYANGLLFGAVHSSWPAPIPLVLLGVALAWLAYRTRSLVGPIVAHGLFNGVTYLTLVLQWWVPALR
jgi:membrane protease YdiL (CAAX protease family)